MMVLVNPPPSDGGGSVLSGFTDAALVAVLVRDEFSGAVWRAAEAALVATAISVLHDLLLGGTLARKSFALDRPIMPTDDEIRALATQTDDRADLVHAAVVDGIRVFRKLTLEGRGWRADGGASLLSYVINGCVLALANHFRRWRNQRSRMLPLEPFDEADRADVASREPDALGHVLAEEDWQRLVGTMPPRLARAAEIWRVTGEPWTRIASRLGISERSLEGLLRRWRQTYPMHKEDPS